jgi:hypothetical protein
MNHLARSICLSPLDPLINRTPTTTAHAHFFAGRYNKAFIPGRGGTARVARLPDRAAHHGSEQSQEIARCAEGLRSTGLPD